MVRWRTTYFELVRGFASMGRIVVADRKGTPQTRDSSLTAHPMVCLLSGILLYKARNTHSRQVECTVRHPSPRCPPARQHILHLQVLQAIISPRNHTNLPLERHKANFHTDRSTTLFSPYAEKQRITRSLIFSNFHWQRAADSQASGLCVRFPSNGQIPVT